MNALLENPSSQAVGRGQAQDNSAAHVSREKAFSKEIHKPDADYNANVPCDLITADPNNRDRIDAVKVQSLAASIKSDGLLQPIVLRLLPDGIYRIIAGEHRWRAHLALKRPTISARIYRNETELSAARKKTVENFQRVALTPIEEAKKYKELAELGMKQKEIGLLLGKSQPVIANALRLLDLPPEAHALLAEGKLNTAQGVSICRFSKWPKVAAKIAECAAAAAVPSKQLDRDTLPFSSELTSAGLIESVPMWRYKLSAALKKHENYVESRFGLSYSYFICPAPAEWHELKKATDEAAVKEEAKLERVSKQGGAKAAAAQRKRKIAKNKEVRAQIDEALAKATSHLKTLKLPKALLIVMKTACEDRRHNSRIPAAAEALGFKMPPAAVKKHQYGGPSYDLEVFRGVHGDIAAVNVAALAILLSQVHDSKRFVNGPSEDLVYAAGAKGGK